ncbi:virion structural protein [Pseudomonas phage 201phi2-1]|uniref:Virion structural protein n=1 Tax=Pseudomonas phage 201phi2-1 TaxID=198110 RepID=B3FJU9_BP201|nr:virion structural protein [Pseudomonas phage 201phi2-1]ABY63264.1 virion structural protein [Pseudomonas phage 201phi2-1]
MRIDLTNYNTTADSTINIYRSYETFTYDKCPTPLVSLPATTTEYHDTTVELNRLVYYRIGVVHNASEIVGPMYTTMKKYFTGPQVNPDSTVPDMILRGDAKVGRYGSIPLNTVYPVSQLPVDFPNIPWIEGVDHANTNVEKCLIDDKVLFITDVPVVQGSLEELYKAGALFSSGDGKDQLNAVLYNSITTKVQQGRKVHANGFTYRFRLMTENEFNQLYIKLYPSSVLGNQQEVAISNNNPHTYSSPVVTSSRMTEADNLSVDLAGNQILIDWNGVHPLFMVLELVSRSDTAFPDSDVVVKPTLPEDRMMMCGAEVVNNRVHFFGGISTTFTTGLDASTRHISFDLNGEDEQIHAPLPVGVYQPVTWVYNNKIYCFGGVKRIGTTEWSYQELYNDVQVWEDNGTPEGLWTTLTTNVTFGFGSSGTVYFDTALNKDMIFIFGAYYTEQPTIASTYYSAEAATFDGTLQTGTTGMPSTSGGAAVGAYAGYLMEVGGTRSANGYTNAAYRKALPLNPPNSFYMSSITTQGTELPVTKGGKLFTWRDTLFLVTSASIPSDEAKFYVYQWLPNESRWLKVMADVPSIGAQKRFKGTSTFHNNRIYTMLSQPWLNDTSDSILLVLDLADPLETVLKPINTIAPQVDRIYPPYAKVVVQ